MTVAFALWFGFWRRFYGAEKPSWFVGNRLIGYALPLGLAIAWVYDLPWYHYASMTAAFYLGMTLVKYAKHWELKTAYDWAVLAFCGMVMTCFAGGLIAIYDPQAGVICGLSGVLMPVGYKLGQYMPKVKFLSGFTEWGEFLGHALIGFVFAVTA